MSGATTLPRRSFGETMRADVWWTQPLLVFLGLSTFIVYSTWAAFQGTHYFFGNYVSPFYSPEIFGGLAAQLVWTETNLVAGLAFVFARASDPVGAGRFPADLLLLSRRLLQSLLGRPARLHRGRAAQNLSRRAFLSAHHAKRAPLFSLSRARLHRHSHDRRVEGDVVCGWIRHRDRNHRTGNQRRAARRLYFRLSFLAPLDRRFSRSTRKIDIIVSRLCLCDLFQPAPHALGVAQFVLGRFLRSVRAAVFDGHLARFRIL